MRQPASVIVWLKAATSQKKKSEKGKNEEGGHCTELENTLSRSPKGPDEISGLL